MRRFLPLFSALLLLALPGCSLFRGITLVAVSAQFSRIPDCRLRGIRIEPFFFSLAGLDTTPIRMRFTATRTVDDAVAWYQANLPANGWTLEDPVTKKTPQAETGTYLSGVRNGWVQEKLEIKLWPTAQGSPIQTQIDISVEGNYWWSNQGRKLAEPLGQWIMSSNPIVALPVWAATSLVVPIL